MSSFPSSWAIYTKLGVDVYKTPELLSVYFYAQRIKRLGTFPSKITLFFSFCLSCPRMRALCDEEEGKCLEIHLVQLLLFLADI